LQGWIVCHVVSGWIPGDCDNHTLNTNHHSLEQPPSIHFIFIDTNTNTPLHPDMQHRRAHPS
jgi:hypothetical protein